MNILDKPSSTGQTLGAKTYKKYCHVDILEDIVLKLAIGVYCEGRAYKLLLSTNHIAKFFFHSTYGHSVTCP
jgi:hypothetical protein